MIKAKGRRRVVHASQDKWSIWIALLVPDDVVAIAPVDDGGAAYGAEGVPDDAEAACAA